MPEQYYSFLLRMWLTNSGKTTDWRLMLENPHTHEVIAFDGLEAFFDYLADLSTSSEVMEQEDKPVS